LLVCSCGEAVAGKSSLRGSAKYRGEIFEIHGFSSRSERERLAELEKKMLAG